GMMRVRASFRMGKRLKGGWFGGGKIAPNGGRGVGGWGLGRNKIRTLGGQRSGAALLLTPALAPGPKPLALRHPRPAPCSDESVIAREHDGFRARVDAEFFEDVREVIADGLFADEELRGDLAVAFSAGDEPQDRILARRELGEVFD